MTGRWEIFLLAAGHALAWIWLVGSAVAFIPTLQGKEKEPALAFVWCSFLFALAFGAICATWGFWS